MAIPKRPNAPYGLAKKMLLVQAILSPANTATMQSSAAGEPYGAGRQFQPGLLARYPGVNPQVSEAKEAGKDEIVVVGRWFPHARVPIR
jgi:hypothetical protein